jgi:hypothetical protein
MGRHGARDAGADASWEVAKAREAALSTYSLPRWYLAWGVWLWPLAAVLVLVLLIGGTAAEGRFVAAWGLFMVALGLLGLVALRNWPID